MHFDAVKDSGAREEFTTGSVRDTRHGKGRFDLVSPVALRRLAQHFENGAVKYGERNWELGQPVARYIDSAIRHLYDFIEGKRDEDHLAAAAWNAMAAIHTEEMVRRGRLPASLLSSLPDYTECRGDAAEQPRALPKGEGIHVQHAQQVVTGFASGY